jgi:hypothetical protein
MNPPDPPYLLVHPSCKKLAENRGLPVVESEYMPVDRVYEVTPDALRTWTDEAQIP